MNYTADCDSLAAHLRSKGITAVSYHAQLEDEVRHDAMRRWRANEVQWLVCSNAAGMGIHKPDVRVVMHAKITARIEDYVQESGRAGRDGLPALCLALYDDMMLRYAASVTPLVRGTGALQRLRQMVALLVLTPPTAAARRERSHCHRERILSLMNVKGSVSVARAVPASRCCDACRPWGSEPETVVRTPLPEQVL